MEFMSMKRIAGANSIHEAWGPAFREMGLEYVNCETPDEVVGAGADCILLDARRADWTQGVARLKGKTPILSVVPESVGRKDLEKLKAQGTLGYVTENTPIEEVLVRVRALLNGSMPGEGIIDSRAAPRVWFQQEVQFKVFDRSYSAWSTTLSETGIFLRTSLTFPLYSMIHLSFHLLGESRPFTCDGVIVRQEVEGDIRGLGIMFQNLTGEKLRMLEAFIDLYRV